MTEHITETAASRSGFMRYLVMAVLVLGAFLGAYRVAGAVSRGPGGDAQRGDSVWNGAAADSGVAPAAAGGASGMGCACCGSNAPTANGLTGEPSEGRATREGDVQRISVDLSQGYYDPNVVVLEAGVPAQITFGQSSGCTAQVMSEQLGFFEDLTGGPRTVNLPALEPGEYAFSCGMQMVFGKIVVQ